MSVAGNQRRILLELLGRLRPHWRRDAALPVRLERMLRGDRRLGSRDRRLYRELTYTTLRHLPWLEPLLDSAPDRAVDAIAWLAAETPDTRAFRAESAVAEAAWLPSNLAGGSQAASATTTVAAKAAALAALIGAPPPDLLPAWFRAECPEAFASPHYDALARRAPLWLRLQTPDPGAVLAEFDARAWPWRRSPLLPDAVEIQGEADVTKTEAFAGGQVEIQDLGSQLILASAGVEPGQRWLDACAGAGGKSLQLATLLGPDGRVEAHDIRPAALAELAQRAARAGLDTRITLPKTLTGPYDGVLIDAPCSGTGTWRRAPHLKWVTTPASVAACARRQLALLARFAPLVAPAGRLLYATCSLCPTENESVIDQFLSTHPNFVPHAPPHPFAGRPRAAGLLFLPADHNGDGFYIAALRRNR